MVSYHLVDRESYVTCDEIGHALERICLNAPIPNPLTRVLKGWRKAAHRRALQTRFDQASENAEAVFN